MPSDDRPGELVPITRGRFRSTPRAIRIARAVAVVADIFQIIFFPLFLGGFASVPDDVLDALVGITMVWLVGWHLAFLPTIVVEALPVGDLAPTWTIAVFLATRSKATKRPD